jgi:hypothetical protein
VHDDKLVSIDLGTGKVSDHPEVDQFLDRRHKQNRLNGTPTYLVAGDNGYYMAFFSELHWVQDNGSDKMLYKNRSMIKCFQLNSTSILFADGDSIKQVSRDKGDQLASLPFQEFDDSWFVRSREALCHQGAPDNLLAFQPKEAASGIQEIK